MPSFVPPQIVANDANASAVRRGDTTAMVFWTPGSVAGVTSNSPAIVFMNPTDMWVTDPTNGIGSFTVTVGNAAYTVQRDGGRTYHVRFGPRRRRAAGR